MHVVKGIKYWDTCASEALIRARFGIVTNKDREPIFYDPTLSDYTITNGLLFARNESIYDLCYERLKPYLENLHIEGGHLKKI